MNYLILAPKRSGHHVLVNWIQAHTKQEHYNNCCFGWDNKKLLTMKGRKEAKSGIVNIEDFNPDSFYKYDFPRFPFLEDCKIIVFMRILDNWLASCYARKFQDNEERKDVYRYLKTPYINDSKLQSPSRIDVYCKLMEFGEFNTPHYRCVTFEHFIQTRGLRMKLADELGFKWNEKADKSIKKESKFGGGSSFNNPKYDILNRGKIFRDNVEFNVLSRYATKKLTKTTINMFYKH
jgi:hypothetical protein